MRYSTNIFPIIIEDLSDLFFLEIPHEVLSVSTTRIIRDLRVALMSSGQLPQDLSVGRTLDGNLVIFSSSEDSIRDLLRDEFKILLEDTMDIELLLDRLIKLRDISLEDQYRILYGVAKDLENRILQCIHEQGWIITSRRRIYKRHESHVINHDRTREIVDIYRSLSIKVIPFNAMDSSFSQRVIIGLIADYSLVIEPTITMEQIVSKKIVYPYNAISVNVEIDRFFYKEQRKIVWEIKEISEEDIVCVRIRKVRSDWRIVQQRFLLSECYPLPRPEVLDDIREKLRIDGSITKIVKLASFHITEASKKDRYAALKRFENTQILLENLIFSLQGMKFIGREITIESTPLKLFIGD